MTTHKAFCNQSIVQVIEPFNAASLKKSWNLLGLHATSALLFSAGWCPTMLLPWGLQYSEGTLSQMVDWAQRSLGEEPVRSPNDSDFQIMLQLHSPGYDEKSNEWFSLLISDVLWCRRRPLADEDEMNVILNHYCSCRFLLYNFS